MTIKLATANIETLLHLIELVLFQYAPPLLAVYDKISHNCNVYLYLTKD